MVQTLVPIILSVPLLLAWLVKTYWSSASTFASESRDSDDKQAVADFGVAPEPIQTRDEENKIDLEPKVAVESNASFMELYFSFLMFPRDETRPPGGREGRQDKEDQGVELVDSSTHTDQARTQSSYAAVETRDAKESMDIPAAGAFAGEEVEVEAEAEGEGDRADSQANSADKYLSLVVYLSYLVLPSVTTTIFSAFPFIDMNPSKVTGLPVPDKYLAADFSIVYDSPRYWQGVYWAIAMIAVYPVGIPLFYFCLLYYNKQSIMEFKQLEIGEALTLMSVPINDCSL